MEMPNPAPEHADPAEIGLLDGAECAMHLQRTREALSVTDATRLWAEARYPGEPTQDRGIYADAFRRVLLNHDL